ncbi:hypothetical protein [Methanopyrus sp.]
MVGLFRKKKEEIDYFIDRRELIDLVDEVRGTRNSFAHLKENVKDPDKKAQDLVEK